ncbi:DNA alkylation repair protein [Candidatus Bathyarchaeota archaeon]|nr:DNA alkylation repair protein [Candidatus Bathyarchaeota archaeon]
MSQLYLRVHAEIEKRSDPKRRDDLLRYFKEPIQTYGLTQGQCKEVAGLIYPSVKGDLLKALGLTEELLASGYLDHHSVGLKLMDRFRRKIKAEHFPVFDGWVEYLNNWASTDGLTAHLISECIKDDPSLVEQLIKWTASDNRWRRRAGAVSMIPIARKGDMLIEVFRIADRLMPDGDDMVQKGVGWMLKEASHKHPREIHDYLVKWKPKTSALTLRYASEKLPAELKVYKTK